MKCKTCENEAGSAEYCSTTCFMKASTKNKEIAILRNNIAYEEQMYESFSNFPTETKQYYNALSKHGQKINDMKKSAEEQRNQNLQNALF